VIVILNVEVILRRVPVVEKTLATANALATASVVTATVLVVGMPAKSTVSPAVGKIAINRGDE
jgi:pyruvate kinase